MHIQEDSESLLQPGLEQGLLLVLADEGHETGEEDVGIRLPVDLVDDVRLGEPVGRIEIGRHLGRKTMVEPRSKELLAVPASARLISENVGQSRHFLVDFIAIEMTAVRARSDDAGDARTTIVGAEGGANEVVVDDHTGPGEDTLEALLDDAAELLTAASRSVKEDVRDVGGDLLDIRIGPHHLLHQIGRVEIGVESHRVEFRDFLARFIEQLPVALRRSAVRDQDAHGLSRCASRGPRRGRSSPFRCRTNRKP